MADDLREKIAEVLAGHRIRRDVPLLCTCGYKIAYGGGAHRERVDHERHVAEAILAAIGERVLPEDTEDHRQYGRRMPNGLVLASHLPDSTHYRLNGPWLPVDESEDPRRALTEGQADG